LHNWFFHNPCQLPGRQERDLTFGEPPLGVKNCAEYLGDLVESIEASQGPQRDNNILKFHTMKIV
jgi:hypothetical protein